MTVNKHILASLFDFNVYPLSREISAYCQVQSRSSPQLDNASSAILLAACVM